MAAFVFPLTKFEFLIKYERMNNNSIGGGFPNDKYSGNKRPIGGVYDDKTPICDEKETKRKNVSNGEFSTNGLPLMDRKCEEIESDEESEDERKDFIVIFESVIYGTLDALYDGKVDEQLNRIYSELGEIEDIDLSLLKVGDQKACEKFIEDYIKTICEETKTDLNQTIAKSGGLGVWLNVLRRLTNAQALTEEYFNDKLIYFSGKERKDGKNLFLTATEGKNIDSLIKFIQNACTDGYLSVDWVIDFLTKEAAGKSVVQRCIDADCFKSLWAAIAEDIKSCTPGKCLQLAVMEVHYRLGMFMDRQTSVLGYVKFLKCINGIGFEKIVKKQMKLAFDEYYKDLAELTISGQFLTWIMALGCEYSLISKKPHDEYALFCCAQIMAEVFKLDATKFEAFDILDKIFTKKDEECGRGFWHGLGVFGVAFSDFLAFMMQLEKKSFLKGGYMRESLIPHLIGAKDQNGFCPYQLAVAHSKESLCGLLEVLFDAIDSKILPEELMINFISMPVIDGKVFQKILDYRLAEFFLNKIKKHFNSFSLNNLITLFSTKVNMSDNSVNLNTTNIPERIVTGKELISVYKPTISLVRQAVKEGIWNEKEIVQLLNDKGASEEEIEILLLEE
ncbi:MAG: hypothetical protein CO175_00965 [Verrucomicrobia bacterium CG_4_9_14_3_um_filter_43_20]|nr:MAG: hypothetical protein AUJ82_07745 [Verrucomicrobia bacterium CG1_02_43_26]PIY61291.1 MAG: hypothetical protein COY94_06085 [Verrucomicrobia bacterium CG_4_10_14_0_8_um_filter_43_34]PJA44818.1 MAG: hypothetical protein CO175_00965 [Verrucomicrobia bacterium CG_4_9_14_3_um_filter_43_20]